MLRRFELHHHNHHQRLLATTSSSKFFDVKRQLHKAGQAPKSNNNNKYFANDPTTASFSASSGGPLKGILALGGVILVSHFLLNVLSSSMFGSNNSDQDKRKYSMSRYPNEKNDVDIYEYQRRLKEQRSRSEEKVNAQKNAISSSSSSQHQSGETLSSVSMNPNLFYPANYYASEKKKPDEGPTKGSYPYQ